jgi:hypothetical protein
VQAPLLLPTASLSLGAAAPPRRFPAPAGPDRLVETFYDEVKESWEGRFESRYGFWRAAAEAAVYAFLDCGIYDQGFARVRCDSCSAEYLVAFSCQQRGLCPSCAAKRGALFGAFLTEEVREPVGHCLWTFTVPKMLRLRDGADHQHFVPHEVLPRCGVVRRRDADPQKREQQEGQKKSTPAVAISRPSSERTPLRTKRYPPRC